MLSGMLSYPNPTCKTRFPSPFTDRHDLFLARDSSELSATPFMSEAKPQGACAEFIPLSIPKRGKVRVRVISPVTQLVMNLACQCKRRGEMQG